jgi:hypothetical protein
MRYESSTSHKAAHDPVEVQSSTQTTAKKRAEHLELADSLERAGRVAWRWLRNDESAWERAVTLRMLERLSRAARDLRASVEPGAESDVG